MRFGAVFATGDFGNDRGAIRAFAQGVEQLGFDHLITYDHVVGAPHDGRSRPLEGPYDEHDEFHEPFVLFGYLGAVTERIELVTGVLVAPQRQTVLVAKQAAEAHALSAGRLRLALGTGWNHVEYEALGVDFGRRGAILNEQALVLRRLWSEPLLSFEGRFHKIERTGILPLPETPIPLWFGGYTPPALRRSILHGDGHLFGHLNAATIGAAAELRTAVLEAERDPSSFGMEAITDTMTEPEHWSETAARWRDVGGTHLSIRTIRTSGVPDSGCRSVDEHLTAFSAWRDALRDGGVWPER